MCVILLILPCGSILQVFLVMSDTSESDNAAKTYGITYLRNAALESKAERYIRRREMSSAYIKHTKTKWTGFAKVKWRTDAAHCSRTLLQETQLPPPQKGEEGALGLCITLYSWISPASWADTLQWQHVPLPSHRGISNIPP